MVVLRVLMLLFTYQTVCVFNIYKGKKDLSGVEAASSPGRRAFMLDLSQQGIFLLEASPFRRGGRVADGEV